MNGSKTATPILSNRVYDVLKWIAQIALPALGTLYFTLAQTWEWPNAEQVVGTITAIDFFLGALLGLSTSSYKKSDERFDGALNIQDTADKTILTLDVSEDPEVIEKKKEVLFKVNHTQDELAP